MKRAAEALGGNYTSSAVPDRRRLTDTLPNLQGAVGEARGRFVEMLRWSQDSFNVCVSPLRRMTKGCPGPFCTRAQVKDKGRAQLQRHNKRLLLVVAA